MDSRRKNIIKSSVRSSIEKLLGEARKSFGSDPVRSKRYVGMAFELLKKNKVRLPRELSNSFCRKCHSVWIPGKSVTVYYDKKTDALRVRCTCGFSKRL
jgi:ribonuclease P protein subunit RPR2